MVGLIRVDTYQEVEECRTWYQLIGPPDAIERAISTKQQQQQQQQQHQDWSVVWLTTHKHSRRSLTHARHWRHSSQQCSLDHVTIVNSWAASAPANARHADVCGRPVDPLSTPIRRGPPSSDCGCGLTADWKKISFASELLNAVVRNVCNVNVCNSVSILIIYMVVNCLSLMK